MKDKIPYPSATKLQRDRSLYLCRILYRECLRKLEMVRDPRYTQMDPEWDRILSKMVDEYHAEIHRLKSIRFPNHGVTEI